MTDRHMEMCLTFARCFKDYLTRRAALDRPDAVERWREYKEQNPDADDSGFKTLSGEEARQMALLAAQDSGVHVLWIPLKCPACGDKSITNFFRRSPAGSWIIDEAVCRCRECGHWFYSADAIDKEEDFGKYCFMQAEQMREAELRLARAAERSAARGGSAPAPPGKPDAAPARRTDKTKGEIKRFLIGAIGAAGLIALFKEAAGADFPFGVVWAAAVIAAAAYLAYKLLPNGSDGGGDAAGQSSPARSETAPMGGNDELPGAEHAAAPAVSEQSVRAGQTIDTPQGKIIIDLMVSRMISSGGIYCKERYRGRTLDGRRVTVVIRSDSGGNRSVRVRPY